MGPLLPPWRDPQARPAHRPHDRPHHVPERRRDERKFGRSLRPRELLAGQAAPSADLATLLRDYHYSTQDIEFQIESYLRYQGDKFSDYFDANTYLLITARWTTLTRPAGTAATSPRRWRPPRRIFCWSASAPTGAFAPALARDRQGAARQPAQRDLRRDRRAHGHDAFLLDDARYLGVVGAYFDRIAKELA